LSLLPTAKASSWERSLQLIDVHVHEGSVGTLLGQACVLKVFEAFEKLLVILDG